MSTLRTIGSGALEFIASSGAISDAANVSFTQFNSNIYDHYIFYLQYIIPVSDNVNLMMRTSTDGGSSYASTSGDYHTGGTANSDGMKVALNVGSDTNEYGVSGKFTLFAPHLPTYTYGDNTNILYGYALTSTSIYRADAIFNSANMRLSAEDVNAVQFLQSSGNIESGEITMFGITNS